MSTKRRNSNGQKSRRRPTKKKTIAKQTVTTTTASDKTVPITPQAITPKIDTSGETTEETNESAPVTAPVVTVIKETKSVPSAVDIEGGRGQKEQGTTIATSSSKAKAKESKEEAKETKEPKESKEESKDSKESKESTTDAAIKIVPKSTKPKRTVSLKRGALFGTTSSPCSSLSHNGGIKCCSFSPNGKQIVAGDDSNVLIVRDVCSGRTTCSSQLTGAVWGCAFSPDGKYVCCGDASGRHSVFDVLTGKKMTEIIHPWNEREEESTRVEKKTTRGGGGRFNHGARRSKKKKKKKKFKHKVTILADGTKSTTISPEEMRSSMGGGVAYTSDGKYCCISDFTNKVHLLDVKKKYQIMASIAHEGGVFGVAVGGRSLLATADLSGEKVILRSLPSLQVQHVFDHTDDVNCVAFTKNTQMIAAGDDGFNVVVRECDSGSVVHTFLYKAPINSISFSYDGFNLAVCGADLTVRDVGTGDVTLVYPHANKLWSCDFSPCNRIIAAVDDARNIVLRDLLTDEFEHTLFTNKNTEMEQAAAERKALATMGKDGNEKDALASVAAPSVSALALCCGKLAVASKLSTLIVSTKTGAPSQEFVATKEIYRVNCVAFSADGRLLAMGDDSGRIVVRVVDTDSANVLFTIAGSNGESPTPIKCICFSPGLTELAVAGEENTNPPGTSKGIALLASSDGQNRIVLRCLNNPMVEMYSLDTEPVISSLNFVPGSSSDLKLCTTDLYDRVTFYSTFADSNTLALSKDPWNFTNLGSVKCIDFTSDGKVALVGVSKKMLVLQVDGSGVPTDTRELPGVIKDVKVNEFCGSNLAVCALKNGDLNVYDLLFPNEKGLLYSLECGSSCWHAAVSDEIMVVGGGEGKITIVPHPLAQPPKFVNVEWEAMFRHRPHLLLQPCCLDDDAASNEDDGGDDQSVRSWSSLGSDLGSDMVRGEIRKARRDMSQMRRRATQDINSMASLGGLAKVSPETVGRTSSWSNSDLRCTTPLHLMEHAVFQSLLDVLPPCNTTALCPANCRDSLLDHIFNNREHEKCMIVAKVYPIERADNAAGIAFADWLVRMTGVYDDVIALAIETGVVASPGALPKEKEFQRRALPRELYQPYKCLNIDGLLDHNKTIVQSSPEPAINSETKAPLHDALVTYNVHKPLWEITGGESRGPKIAVEAVAVGPPEFIRRAFPILAQAGSVEVFQTEIMGVVVNFLWHRVKKYYIRQYRQFCCLLFSFLFGIFLDLYIHEQNEFKLQRAEFFQAVALISNGSQSVYPYVIVTSRGCLLMSFAIAIVFFLRELKQMCVHGWSEYISSGWNRLEITGYLCVAFTNVWMTFGLPWSNIVTSLSIFCLVCTTMAHLRGFSQYSPIITCFIQIVSDMKSFFMIVLLLWIGATLAFKALMPYRREFQSANGLWTVWQMVLGDVVPDVVDFRREDWQQAGESELWALATASIGKLLSGTFVLMVVVVLMNQLIALMGDSYDRVQENYDVQARISRARVIVDMMDLYVDPSDTFVFARWIHVLRPAGAHARNGKNGWQGRLKAVKKAVAQAEKKITKVLTAEFDLQLQTMEGRLSHKLEELLRKMDEQFSN